MSKIPCLIVMLAGCAAGPGEPPPPPKDFSVAVSPSSTGAVIGNSTPGVTISIEPQNGFSGTVGIVLQGIPTGITVMPGTNFSLAAGANQSITFGVSTSAPVGPFPITIQATSGMLSHQTQLTLTAEGIANTYQAGSALFLESGSDTDRARVGLDTTWGGSIVEVSLNGTNFVNRHDTGREVQTAFRDGGNIDYNPTPAGDDLDQGTPVISYAVTADSLYIKSQPLEWAEEAYGGTLGHPIAGDILLEQTVTAVTKEPHTFKVHIKATHLGNDLHENGGQEFPAVYTNRDYGRFLAYLRKTPWTNGATQATQLPEIGQPNPPYYVPERWGALVNSQDQGLTVYVPSVNPWFIGFTSIDNSTPGGSPTDNSTNYFAPLGNLTMGPGFVIEADFYVIAGDYKAARQTIYRLHQMLEVPVIFTGFEATDQPASGAILSGTTTVSGWAFTDGATITKVEILVDGTTDGTASYGEARPDLPTAYPESPLDVGFSYSLNTTKYPDGPHMIFVRFTDSSGNVAIAPSTPVTISNTSPAVQNKLSPRAF